jgi:hypothetical protein
MLQTGDGPAAGVGLPFRHLGSALQIGLRETLPAPASMKSITASSRSLRLLEGLPTRPGL